MAEAPTPSQTVGPFFGFALPFPGDRQAVDPDAPGAIRIQGQLIDGAGEPVPDGLLEIWQGDQFARSRTDPEGVFQVVVRRPGPVPGPDGRQQAPHLNVTVFARGLLKHLNTRMYFPDEEEANAADPVLQQVDPERRHTLIARGENGVYHFDVRLQGDDETVFFAL
ncbi:MAG TPA: protocatechuate 3,4-dioxygenase subunit alpha [Candidatus Dormibacteraeota bacterium]|jgi:protocatechuate 3,4-dioxygenase alpha subunit|nr:protocatechuate 3,4-dioxygenase subunit alpha [Candidatus Dormibacteraeota bacterium]